MEDIRIGENTRTIERVVPIDLAESNPVKSDPKRTLLVLCSSGAQNLWWSTISGFTMASGIVLLPASAPIVLSVQEWGDIVKYPWFVISGTGPGFASIIEGWLNEQPIRRGVWADSGAYSPY